MIKFDCLAPIALCFLTPALASASPVNDLPVNAPPFVYQVGDVYQLAVTERRTSETTAAANVHDSEIRKEILTSYEAEVEVLEVDDAGQPSKEAHRAVTFVVTTEGKRMTANLREDELVFEQRTRRLPRVRAGGERIDQPFREILTSLVPLHPRDLCDVALLQGPTDSDPEEALSLSLLQDRIERQHGVEIVARSLPSSLTCEGDSETGLRWSFQAELKRLRTDLPENVYIAASAGTFGGTAAYQPTLEGGQFTFESILDYELSGGTNRHGIARNEARWQTTVCIERTEERTFGGTTSVASTRP